MQYVERTRGYHFELHAFDSATRPGALFIILARYNVDGKGEKLCVRAKRLRETFRLRFCDANFKVFAETFFHLFGHLAHPIPNKNKK